MTTKSENSTTRREFMRNGGRNLILTAMGVGGVTLATRKGDPNPHVCSGDGVCRNCGSLSACILPQAKSTRKGLEK